MASDSRVSGSEDARTPTHGKGAEGPSNSPGAVEQPNSRHAPTAGQRGGTPQQPTAAGKAATTAPTATSEPATTAKPAGASRPAATAKSAEVVQPTASVADGGEAVESIAGAPPSDDPKSATAEQEPSRLLAAFMANHFLLFNAVPSWLVSMVVHAVLLIVLALITLPERPPEKSIVAVASPDNVEDVENLESEQIDSLDVNVFEGLAPAEEIDNRTTPVELDVPSLDDMGAAPDQFKLEDFGDKFALSDDLLDRIGGGKEGGLGEARGEKGRKDKVARFGGSEGSEAAVAAALAWLAAHQELDGGWDFDHTKGPCKGQCSHPGLLPPARNGATAMALLPFLGAGQTHKEGKYQKTVGQGLAFLIRQMKLANGMGDLSDPGGRLYSHGLATITLCEAYAMTNDQELMQPAQLALNFIVYAQDPVGGGWRYEPHQPGDTSVLGWQLMACKSGHMAYLRVPGKTILGASKFLDFVQDQSGSQYGYTVPGGAPATTAVGLLCRMYLGWKQDNPALKGGVEYLHQMGPSDNMYYNYYATQVMRHYGGEYWNAWNAKMRDQLVTTQDEKGHATGSWYFPKATYADRGGRLYCTSMATMILEVYYRHLPIYGKQAAEEDFPL